MSIKCIIGLGNPGRQYENTHHNVGFMAIDKISGELSVSVNQLKWHALIGEARIGSDRVILMKPQTYMNNSGIAVRELVNFYKIEAEDIIVICDDIDINFGTIRIKKNGTAGTHNGLKSIVKELGISNFVKLKIAVGHKPQKMDLADFVLSKFTSEDKKIIDEEMEIVKDAANMIIRKGVDLAMNEFNGWTAPSMRQEEE